MRMQDAQPLELYRRLTEREELALATMAARPHGWRSKELSAAILARNPQIASERMLRKTYRKLEELHLAECSGTTNDLTWKATGRSISRRNRGRMSVALSLALAKLRQLAGNHLPTSALDSIEAEVSDAMEALSTEQHAGPMTQAKAWVGKTARLGGGYPLLAPVIRDEVFRELCRALYRDESVELCYKNARRGEPEKSYRVLPYALVEKGPLWYLVARKKGKLISNEKSIRVFRLDRVVQIKIVGMDMSRDSRFDLETFIRCDRSFEFFADDPVQVCLRVSENTDHEHAFRSLRLSEDQAIVDERAGFLLTATVSPSLPFLNLMVEMSASVEVIAPESLRRQVIDRLRRAQERYGLTMSHAAK